MSTSKIVVIALLLFLFTLRAQSEEAVTPQLRTVEQFFVAFNAHDIDAMAALVAEDVDWLRIAGDKITIETRGKKALLASMDEYFKSCPTCQSTFSDTISTAGRVSAIETASWQGKSGLRSQRALFVYEFAEGLIQRVYYFPAET